MGNSAPVLIIKDVLYELYQIRLYFTYKCYSKQRPVKQLYETSSNDVVSSSSAHYKMTLRSYRWKISQWCILHFFRSRKEGKGAIWNCVWGYHDLRQRRIWNCLLWTSKSRWKTCRCFALGLFCFIKIYLNTNNIKCFFSFEIIHKYLDVNMQDQ